MTECSQCISFFNAIHTLILSEIFSYFSPFCSEPICPRIAFHVQSTVIIIVAVCAGIGRSGIRFVANPFHGTYNVINIIHDTNTLAFLPLILLSFTMQFNCRVISLENVANPIHWKPLSPQKISYWECTILVS